MAIKFNRSQTFATGGIVTSAALHNLVDGTDIYPAIITDQANLSTVSTADKLLIADTDDTVSAKSTTVQNLFEDALSSGTYTDAYLTGNFTTGTANITTGTIPNLTIGTTTATRGTVTTLNSTTGTITNLTAGTTIGTASAFTNGTITTGVIPTLTAGTTTSTAANITTGTVQTLSASTGTITTGTIAQLTTTLSGDFAISSGTGTLGTTGVTAGTYGTNTSAITLAIDAKGRITTVSTSEIQTTPADGSITYAKLSTSGTESANVAKRTAKAWVNFNGTGTVAIRDDFNVSSITDNGVGDFSVNFSTAMADANYAVTISAMINLSGVAQSCGASAISTSTTYSSSMSTGFCRIEIEQINTGGQQDPLAATAIFFSS